MTSNCKRCLLMVCLVLVLCHMGCSTLQKKASASDDDEGSDFYRFHYLVLYEDLKELWYSGNLYYGFMYLDSESYKEALVAPLALRRAVRFLDLEYGMPAEQLQGIADAFPYLVALDVSGTHLDEDALQALSECRELRMLIFDKAAAGFLEGLHRLRLEALTATGLTYVQINHISQWGNYEYMRLQGCDLSDRLAHVSDGRLRHLHLDACSFNEDSLLALPRDQMLSFSIRHTTGSNLEESLSHMLRSTSLQALALTFSDVDDDALRGLGGHNNLKSLILTGTRVSDASVRRINRVRTLEELEINGTQISAAGIRSLMQARHLARLVIDPDQAAQLDLDRLRAKYPHVEIEVREALMPPVLCQPTTPIRPSSR